MIPRRNTELENVDTRRSTHGQRGIRLQLFFTNEVIGDLLESSLETAELGADGFTDVGEGPGSPAGRDIDWLTIADRQGAVVEDVEKIRNHPLVPGNIPIYGYVYDVKSGKLIEVPKATEAGKAEFVATA